MKLKIQIQLNAENNSNTEQKPPLDRRKVLIFIMMLMTPAALWASYFYFDGNDSDTAYNNSAKRVSSAMPEPLAATGNRDIISQPISVAEKVSDRTEQVGARQQVENLSLQTPVSGSEEETALVDLVSDSEKEAELVTPVTDSEEKLSLAADNEQQQALEKLVPESVDFSVKIPRTVLTSGISNREPVDDLGAGIAGDAEQKVYLFSEVRGMTGQKITHRWLLNDQVMASIKLSVGGERWRTYSSKTIVSDMTGHWRIEVVDGSGQLLTAHNFDYYH